MKTETEYDLFVRVDERDIQKARRTIKAKTWEPWDPVDAFDPQRIENNVSVLLAKYDKLKKDPGLPARQRKRVILTATVILALAILAEVIFSVDGPLILGIVLAFGVVFIPWLYYRKLAVDLVKIQIADKMDWYYDPDRDEKKWGLLLKRFPEVFTKSGKKPGIEDQFWGIIKRDGMTPFYSGVLYFQTTTGKTTRSEAGRGSTRFSSKRNFHRHFFCFRIGRALKAKLFIKTEPVDKKLLQENPDQIPFMKAFRFDFEGEAGGEEAISLARSLSSEVQKKLIGLRREADQFSILFSGDSVIFMIGGDMLRKVHTSLFNGVTIDPRDSDFVNHRLSALFDITQGIIKNLS